MGAGVEAGKPSVVIVGIGDGQGLIRQRPGLAYEAVVLVIVPDHPQLLRAAHLDTAAHFPAQGISNIVNVVLVKRYPRTLRAPDISGNTSTTHPTFLMRHSHFSSTQDVSNF